MSAPAAAKPMKGGKGAGGAGGREKGGKELGILGERMEAGQGWGRPVSRILRLVSEVTGPSW